MEELIKEVYAAFGLAYYYGEVLHRGLSNIFAFVTFKSPNDVTVPRIDEKLSQAYSLTLGLLIQELEPILPPDLFDRCKEALEKRNFLAHDFWFERSPMMFSEEGLSAMHQELQDVISLFSNLDTDLDNYFQPTMQSFGVTGELLEQAVNQLAQGIEDNPLTSQRRLKKAELVVKAWDVTISEESITQIFETSDGCLWQLCDIGLGWTKLSKPDASWKINEIIQKYLPATINPHPVISDAWNYKFALIKGAELVISRSNKDKSYKLRIGVKK